MRGRGGRGRVVAAALVLAACVTMPAAFPVDASAQTVAEAGTPDPAAGSRTVTFAPDPDPNLPNPERGLNTIVSDFQTLVQGQIDHAVAQGWTLIHAYVDLSDFVHVDVLPDDLLLGMDAAFRLVREAGLKVILRFSYSPGGTVACGGNNGTGSHVIAGPSDAPVDRIVRHIEQVAPVVRAHWAVISSIEAGFLGEFGEWHCSTYNRTDPDDNRSPLREDAKAAVLDAELLLFPLNRQIALRRPTDIFALVSDYASVDSRVGNHQDCFASSVDDGQTWLPDHRAEEMAEIGRLGERHVVNGVVCSDRPGNRVSCDNVHEMREMHFSYLAGDFEAGALAIYAEQGCWDGDAGGGGAFDQIVPSLGYRLELMRAEVPDRLVPGTTARVRFDLRNIGWAAPFNERPAFLTLSDASGIVASAPLPSDPRTWQPAGDGHPAFHTVEAEVAIPADLAPGAAYSLGLWLPDVAEHLRSDSAYSIRLANLGTWDASTGINVLAADLQVASPAPPPTPTPPPAADAPAELAASGAPAGSATQAAGITFLAVLLIGAGAFLVSTRARRRRRGSD